MNTTNILLGMTSILIVVAFALSFGGLTKGRDNSASKEELAQLKKDIEKVEAQNRLFEVNRARSIRTNYPPVSNTPAPLPIAPGPVATSAPDQATLDKIAELERKNKELEEARVALEQENNMANKERDEIRIKQTMAAKKISMAMDMGTVVKADKEQAIVIYTPSANAPSFQPGKLLAVRRNTGIIGTIVVEQLDASGQYLATMRPHGYSPDGYPDIKPGDTIIIDPNT